MRMPLLIRENKDKEKAVESDNSSNMDKDLMKYADILIFGNHRKWKNFGT